MGKIKTTQKAIKNAYAGNWIFKTGYCNLQTLFHYTEPKAYTCGTYGWNCDLYDIEGVGITTGYRGMVGHPIDHKIINEFETKAQHVVYGDDIAWENKRDELEKLKIEFVKAVKESIK